MHAGSIYWNSLDLSLLGKPRILIRRQPDPPAPAFPTRELVTLTVTVALEAMDPGTLQARVRHLQQAMQIPEGILASDSGSGHAVEWLAVPAGDTLAAALAGNSASIDLSFTAVENHAEAAIGPITAATFTPAGTSTAITLHAARDVREEIGAARHSERASARRLTTTTISLTARIAQADAAAPLATRLAYLQAKAAEVKAINCREGTLVYGTNNAIVRVTEFSPVIDGANGVLDLRLQCFYSVLPDDTVAEANYEIGTRIDAGSGEEVTSYSGTIEAASRTIALAKLQAIRTTAGTAGMRTVFFETKDRVLDGADTAGISGADWTGGISFTLELRKARDGSHYTLRITTSKDIRAGMKWTYSGTVMAATDTAALVTARGLVAAAGHPVRVKADETIEHVTDIDTPGTTRFVKLDFTYDFEGPSDGFIGGEISTDRAAPLFGEWRRVVSGVLVATTRAVAETRLALLLAGEGTAIETTLKWGETYLDETGSDVTPKRVFQRLEFSSGSRELRTNASVKYTDTTTTDIGTLLQTRQVSGSLWSNSQTNAETAFAAFITTLFGGTPPQRVSKGRVKEGWGNALQTTVATTNSDFVQLDFDLGSTTPMTGITGYDILEASYTLERTGCINNTVITPIPYGRPVTQTGTGYLPGSVSVNASCKSIARATARTWVQGKRTLGSGVSGAYENVQPRESETPEYAPYSGTSVTCYKFSGNYQWTVTGTALDGVWGGGFGG